MLCIVMHADLACSAAHAHLWFSSTLCAKQRIGPLWVPVICCDELVGPCQSVNSAWPLAPFRGQPVDFLHILFEASSAQNSHTQQLQSGALALRELAGLLFDDHDRLFALSMQRPCLQLAG